MTTEFRQERSLGELLGQLVRETGTLVRKEVLLARTEFAEKASNAKRGIELTLSGGALLLGGMFFLFAALILGLSTIIPPWIVALSAGVLMTGVGAVLLARGRVSLKPENLVPEQTLADLARDQELVKELMP